MTGKFIRAILGIGVAVAIFTSCSKDSGLLPVNPKDTAATTPGKPSGDTSQPGTSTPGTGVAGNNIDRDALLKLVNGLRTKGCKCGTDQMLPVGPVTWNGLLEKAAYDFSVEMKTKNFFSHTSPDGSTPGSRLDAVGYNWNTYGENIAQGYMDEQSVILGWLNSPGHCKNMMNGNFREMGIGKAGNYWTMELGRRSGN